MTSESKKFYGSTNPTPEEVRASGVRRMASVWPLNLEGEEVYRELHANTWPSIVERLRKSNFRNYSIYIAEIDGKKFVFTYLEYVGTDWEADGEAIAADPETARWSKALRPARHPDPAPKCTEPEMVFFME